MMTTSRSWHVKRWPPLARLETAVKLIALGAGMTTAVTAISAADLSLPGGLRLVQLIILAILSLGLVAAIFDRLADREIVAMIFVILNNLGHWGMVVALLSASTAARAVWLFAGLMLLGDLIKIAFIKVEQFTVRDYSQRVLYGLTMVYVVGYALILLLEALR